jgi:aminoglycoside phosphotransferase (APT) family kinase protein
MNGDFDPAYYIRNKYGLSDEDELTSLGNHLLDRNYVYAFVKDGLSTVIKLSENKENWQNEVRSHLFLHHLSFVPDMMDYGEDNDIYYIRMSRMKGNNLSKVWFEMDSQQKKEISYQSGQVLAKIHAVESFQQFGSWRFRDFLDVRSYRAHKDEIIVKRLQKCQFEDMRLIEDGLEKLPVFREKLKEVIPVLVHKDFSFRNILVDKNEISAVVDYEHARPDDPSIDLCTMIQTPMLDDEVLLKSFKAGYETVRKFPENFCHNTSYYFVITGLYLLSRLDLNKDAYGVRGRHLIKKGLEILEDSC